MASSAVIAAVVIVVIVAAWVLLRRKKVPPVQPPPVEPPIFPVKPPPPPIQPVTPPPKDPSLFTPIPNKFKSFTTLFAGTIPMVMPPRSGAYVVSSFSPAEAGSGYKYTVTASTAAHDQLYFYTDVYLDTNVVLECVASGMSVILTVM